MSFISPQPCSNGISHLTCETDSIIVCPPGDDAPFHVIVDSMPPITIEIPPIEVSLSCETDSITICPPTDDAPFHVIVDNTVPSIPLDCETDSITVCPPVSGFHVIVDSAPPVSVSLDCSTDSVTVCPPDDDAPFHVIVDNTIPSTPLDCEIDSITVCPPVSGFHVIVDSAPPVEVSVSLDCSTDSVTVCPPDDDAPFHVIVDNTVPSLPLDCETDSITVCPPVSGFHVIVDSAPPVSVSLDCETDSITVCQGTDPWIVDGTVNIGTMPEVEIKNDSGNPIPVSGTLTSNQGTSPWVIGDGGSTISIDDGGGSITVDGTITADQGTNPWTVDGTVNIGTMPEVEIKNDSGNPIPVSGTVISVGAYTPSDSQVNPTDLIGTEGFTMIWGPGVNSSLPRWSRWGAYGIDDDATAPRVPGIAIFGRPELNLGETPQQAGVISNLADNADAFHALVVASYARFRDATNPILGRQSDGGSDANSTSTLGISGTSVFNGTTWDRLRGGRDDTDNQAAESLGLAKVVDRNYIWDSGGGNWDRWTGAVTVSSGTVNIGTMPEVEIKNDSGNPIPVSGTVTANQGTSPWVVSGSVNVGTMPEVEIKNDSGNPIPVTLSGTTSTSIDNMSATLDSILSGVRRPLYWDRINNRLFIGPLPGGTVDTVTTVSTVTAINSLNNFGSYGGNAQVSVKEGLLDPISKGTWSLAVRGRIS